MKEISCMTEAVLAKILNLNLDGRAAEQSADATGLKKLKGEALG